jgi:hypothetical protein
MPFCVPLAEMDDTDPSAAVLCGETSLGKEDNNPSKIG